MAWKCHIRSWLRMGLVVAMSSVAASAMPSPIARVGTASKTVMQKTFDGAKTVAKVPVHEDVLLDVGEGAKDAGASVIHHVKSI